MSSGGDLVRAHSPASANARVDERIRWNVRRRATEPEAIEARLAELDREWDVERVLHANATLLTLAGLAMGRLVDRRWYGLSAVVQGLMLEQAVRGWCPPLAALRRLGVRTRSEIERERYALKAVRGDFTGARPRHAEAALDATG